ncbi:hypothetical protein CC2G_014475 [Coprinopsis cinerea AmutBmut pab1-1]|nr:hypothetical protein CC2G_014475 [Coprinopsis cinerea AmutBmut pab1-1]
MAAFVQFITKYAQEYDEAFPLSIDLGPPDVPPQLPTKSLSIPGVGKVGVPDYFAGFFIDNGYIYRHMKGLGWGDTSSLHLYLGREWEERGSPEPFIIPEASRRPYGYLIWFIDQTSPPEDMQKFLTRRDKILDQFCNMMRFTSPEAAFVRRNVKWQRFTPEYRELPPEVILCDESFDDWT